MLFILVFVPCLCLVADFLPRCMQCRRGLAMRILSVRPSVYLSNVRFVTKRKNYVSRFLHHTKDQLA